MQITFKSFSELIYGTFAPGTFNAYISYGRALVDWALEQYSVFKMKTNDEAESTDEEDAQSSIAGDEEDAGEGVSGEEPVNSETAGEATNGEAVNGESEEAVNGESEEVDVNQSPGESLDEFDSILNDAWSVLEVAKTTCEK
jgi:hypothetical protein